MRIENIKVQFSFDVPTHKDLNNYSYDMKTYKAELKNLVGKSINFVGNHENVIIGEISSVGIKENTVIIDGVLLFGGTNEYGEYINDKFVVETIEDFGISV